MALLTNRKQIEKTKKLSVIIAVLMILMSLCDVVFQNNYVSAASFSASVTLSKTEIQFGSSVQLTAGAGGTGSPYQYKFRYSFDNTNFYQCNDYSSSNTFTFKPTTFDILKEYTGILYICSDVISSSGENHWSKSQTLNIMPKDDEALRVSGDVKSAGTYIVGEQLIITLTASGGKAPYEYKYEYMKSGGAYTIYKDYSNTSSIMMNTSSWTDSTDYSIKVTVKDSNGDTFSYLSVVSLKPKPVLIPSISSFSVPSSAKIGDKIKLNCDASGGTGTLQYKFEYIDSDNNRKSIKNYSTADNVTWDTSPLSAGSYTVQVTVKDTNNKEVSQKTTISLSSNPITISSLSVPTSAKVGAELKLNCDASGGTGTLQYKFEYIDSDNNKKSIKGYDTTDNTTWKTSSLSDGNYTVQVTVKDSKGVEVSKKVTVVLSKLPTLSPTVTTSPENAEVVKSKDITFTVNDHAGNTDDYPPHPYQYKFEYKKEGSGSFTILRDYSDDEKYKFNTKDLDAGKYVLKATVRDNNKKEYSKTCNFTVTVPKITFSVDPGSKDFFTGGGSDKAVIEVKNIKGGISDEYEYKFEYIKYGELTDPTLTLPTDSSDWQSIKDFSSESSCDFTVSDDNPGIYAVRVSVQNKDNTDNSLIYRKMIYTYTVKVKVQHTLTDINTLLDKIDTWTSNSIQGDMQSKIEAWSSESEHYDTVPFSYTDYKAAYDAAKASNTNGNKDYDTLYANLETQFDRLQRLVNSGYVSPDLDTGDTPLGIANTIFMLYKSLLSILTDTFKSLSDSSVTSTAMYGFDYNAVADKIFPLFKTFAYSLIIIFAGVNALETALQYEMFTMRGGVKILARLTLAKVWVDISLVVCRGIVSIAIDWLGQITSLTTNILNNINVGATLKSSDAWIIGWLIDFFNGFLLALGMLLLVIPLIVFVIILYAKLFVRSFELTMLQCVSPIFFACLTGETTKQYFKKFILTYISVVFEVVFMAIIWYIYIEYLNEAFSISATTTSITEMYSLESGILNFFMVSVGAFILMIKPPQVLKNLVQ